MTHCPDCGASVSRIAYSEPRCPFKRGPGYGPCGDPRPLMTIEQAARAVAAVAHGDRDGRNIVIPLYEPTGRRRREWFDLRDAFDRADMP